MKSNKIKQKFIDYFQKRGHKYLESSSLVPADDPTLLFTNAGMVQFKDQFTGKSHPVDKQVVTIQRCVRAGASTTILRMLGLLLGITLF